MPRSNELGVIFFDAATPGKNHSGSGGRGGREYKNGYLWGIFGRELNANEPDAGSVTCEFVARLFFSSTLSD